MLLENLTTIFLMNGVILVIPGINFFLVVQFSLLHGFSAGFRCAFGITVAVMLHVILAAFSAHVLFKNYPTLYCIRYVSATYLIYIGTKFLIRSFKKEVVVGKLQAVNYQNSEAFRTGFLVDVLNPFINIFYLSLFSIIMSPEESPLEFCFYCGTIFIMNLSWFILVSLLFSLNSMRNYFQDKYRIIQGFSGLAMYYFSSKVIFGF